MKIELSEWPGNTEVILVDDDGRHIDSFYTNDKNIELPCNVDSREQFRLLEDRLSPPKIGGMFAQFHHYWAERRAQRGVTQ